MRVNVPIKNSHEKRLGSYTDHAGAHNRVLSTILEVQRAYANPSFSARYFESQRRRMLRMGRLEDGEGCREGEGEMEKRKKVEARIAYGSSNCHADQNWSLQSPPFD